MDLFEPTQPSKTGSSPLAARMRPRTLDDILGQNHILGQGRLLRRAIEADRIGSIILYGPPGCGKTSLAEVIAHTTHRRFERSSGVTSNVAALRAILQEAKQRKLLDGTETTLFIDEIHRFNKAQQDVLLPYVEEGDITLIGATTHNPFFFINTPLTSRSQIFQLEAIDEDSIIDLLHRALKADYGLGPYSIRAEDDALNHLARLCEGDARKALSALEIAAMTTPGDTEGDIHIDLGVAEDSIQRKSVLYDKDEDQHYDTISAFIKSVRGSDPHAAVYWLSKMLYAGEDPRFIARRLIILASEDIGNADPLALVITTSALQAVEFIGMPEARITLSQATTYLATAPKSNAAYMAGEKAMADLKAGKTLPVPHHLRDGHYKGSEQLGVGGYQYAHDHPHHFVDQEYIPTDALYYQPGDLGFEQKIKQRMAEWEAMRNADESNEPKK